MFSRIINIYLPKKLNRKNFKYFLQKQRIKESNMHLRSGKIVANTRYNDFKKRVMTVYPIEAVKNEQCNLMRSKLETWDNIIKPHNANELLISIINIPEIIANNSRLRNVIEKRLNEILNHQSFINSIDRDIIIVIKHFFKWLKMRPDYKN